MSHCIREVIIEDVQQLIPLLNQLGYSLSSRDMEDRVKIYTALPGYKLFVSTGLERITGLIALSIHEMLVLPSRKMRIEALVVDEACRRQGIALALMYKAEQYAKEQGCTVIELTSGMRRAPLGTHDFYKKLGYANEGDMAKLYLRKAL